MYCVGGHLGFPIGIKNTIFVEDLPMIIPGQFGFNCLSGFRKSKMAANAIHRLTLDPMGKCSNAFFSETTNMIKAKLYTNVHWMVLYKLHFFCIKNTIFVEDLPMIIPGQFGFNCLSGFREEELNCTRMFIGWSSTNFIFFVPI
jgi:hypothetical protein